MSASRAFSAFLAFSLVGACPDWVNPFRDFGAPDDSTKDSTEDSTDEAVEGFSNEASLSAFITAMSLS
jgi:hypothetical protein